MSFYKRGKTPIRRSLGNPIDPSRQQNPQIPYQAGGPGSTEGGLTGRFQPYGTYGTLATQYLNAGAGPAQPPVQCGCPQVAEQGGSVSGSTTKQGTAPVSDFYHSHFFTQLNGRSASEVNTDQGFQQPNQVPQIPGRVYGSVSETFRVGKGAE